MPLVQTIRLALQRSTRQRAEQIRAARIHPFAEPTNNRVPDFPESFFDIRSLTQTDDDNLEQFLRRNNLTDALHVYLESQAIRNA